jgi:hypothetical protein
MARADALSGNESAPANGTLASDWNTGEAPARGRFAELDLANPVGEIDGTARGTERIFKLGADAFCCGTPAPALPTNSLGARR